MALQATQMLSSSLSPFNLVAQASLGGGIPRCGWHAWTQPPPPGALGSHLHLQNPNSGASKGSRGKRLVASARAKGPKRSPQVQEEHHEAQDKQRGRNAGPSVESQDDEDDDDGEEWVEVDGDKAEAAVEDWEAAEMEREADQLAREYQLGILKETVPEDDEEAEEGRRPAKGKRGKDSKQPPQRDESEVPEHMLPTIAIVGRPNVGKSALFNRLCGGDVAIVYDEPGVTRDRLYGRGFWAGHEFRVVDTGGVMTVPSTGAAGPSDAISVTGKGGSEALAKAVQEAAEAGLPAMIERQAAQAVDESDAIILVVDGQTGPTASDLEICRWLRRRHPGKKMSLAVNKCESPSKGAMQILDFYSFGCTPFAVSAITGTGTGELLDDVCEGLPTVEDILVGWEGRTEEEAELAAGRPTAVAIVGRPNVGKSSILNRIVGEERTIVSPISGTTRDAIDTEYVAPDGQKYRLVDTAGVRRRGAVAAAGNKAEQLSVVRALRAIRRADVVALVIAAMDGITEQDFKLGEMIEKEGKACVIVVNKWDCVPDKTTDSVLFYEEDVRRKLRNLDWAPIVYTSAATGQRVAKIMDTARSCAAERSRRLTTATLNSVITEAAAFRATPATRGGKRGKVFFCTQAAVRPPTFVFFVNEAKLFPTAYRKYMENQIRQNVGYPGTPIRLLWRSRKREPRTGPAPERGASKTWGGQGGAKVGAAQGSRTGDQTGGAKGGGAPSRGQGLIEFQKNRRSKAGSKK